MKRGGKTVAKADLPTKVCAACGLPFTWRRKWARDWEEVKFCSDRCRASKSSSGTGEGDHAKHGGGGRAT